MTIIIKCRLKNASQLLERYGQRYGAEQDLNFLMHLISQYLTAIKHAYVHGFSGKKTKGSDRPTMRIVTNERNCCIIFEDIPENGFNIREAVDAVVDLDWVIQRSSYGSVPRPEYVELHSDVKFKALEDIDCCLIRFTEYPNSDDDEGLRIVVGFNKPIGGHGRNSLIIQIFDPHVHWFSKLIGGFGVRFRSAYAFAVMISHMLPDVKVAYYIGSNDRDSKPTYSTNWGPS